MMYTESGCVVSTRVTRVMVEYSARQCGECRQWETCQDTPTPGHWCQPAQLRWWWWSCWHGDNHQLIPWITTQTVIGILQNEIFTKSMGWFSLALAFKVIELRFDFCRFFFSKDSAVWILIDDSFVYVFKPSLMKMVTSEPGPGLGQWNLSSSASLCRLSCISSQLFPTSSSLNSLLNILNIHHRTTSDTNITSHTHFKLPQTHCFWCRKALLAFAGKCICKSLQRYSMGITIHKIWYLVPSFYLMFGWILEMDRNIIVT